MTQPSPWGENPHSGSPTHTESPTMDSFQSFYERDLKGELEALELERPAKLRTFF